MDALCPTSTTIATGFKFGRKYHLGEFKNRVLAKRKESKFGTVNLDDFMREHFYSLYKSDKQEIFHLDLHRVKKDRILHARRILFSKNTSGALQIIKKTYTGYAGEDKITHNDPRTNSTFGVFCIVNKISPETYKTMYPVVVALESLVYSPGGADFLPQVDTWFYPAKAHVGAYRMVGAGDDQITSLIEKFVGATEFFTACRNPETQYCDNIKKFITLSKGAL